MVLCPVPYRLSNMCLVSASFTEITGNFSTPFSAMLRSRMTPVVVSSVPPITFFSKSLRLRWSTRHDIGSVVHRDLRLVGEGGLDVPIICVVVFAFDRETSECRRAGTSAAATSSWVLSGFEAHSAHIRPAGLESLHQVRGFGRDVQAGRDAHALERLLSLEPFADQPQHRHGGFGPFDLADCPGLPA